MEDHRDIPTHRPRREDVVKLSGTSAAQREAWRDAAAAAHLSLAAWLREAADAAALAGATAAELRAEIAALRVELGRGVGNNLNQLARALNTELKAGRRPSGAAHEAALAAAAAELAVMRRRTESLMRRVERAGQRARRR